jgi:elongation of very long chain fatty acids protein 4
MGDFLKICVDRHIIDPRVAKWPLMASPVPTLLIAMAYLTSIYYGRRFMAKRKPFSIRGILIPYNLAMALLNLYIGLEVIKF